MGRKMVNAMYLLNMLFQSFFNLVMPLLLMLGLSWLLVEKACAPTWLYGVLALLGVVTGLSSMIRFILSACRSMEHLEQERQEKERTCGK